MKVKRQIHKIWKETKGTNINLVGKWQYIYSSDKGKISLVKFIDYLMDGKNFWEIYCLKENLFSDVEL